MKTCRVLLPCALLLWAAISPHRVSAADAPALDPNLPYQAQRSKPVTYDVDLSAIVTAPYQTKVLKVWLPLPPSARSTPRPTAWPWRSLIGRTKNSGSTPG